MKKNFKLYFDMDDTLVDFGSNRHSEDLFDVMYDEGFFLNMEPLPFLGEINKLASLCPENVYILSACVNSPYCKPEKIAWLKKYLPAAMKENVIFTEAGEDKTKAVNPNGRLSKFDILIDDYSRNVFDWEKAGGTAIKFKNSFNTSNPAKYKHVIKDFSELIATLENIRTELDIEGKEHSR